MNVWRALELSAAERAQADACAEFLEGLLRRLQAANRGTEPSMRLTVRLSVSPLAPDRVPKAHVDWRLRLNSWREEGGAS